MRLSCLGYWEHSSLRGEELAVCWLTSQWSANDKYRTLIQSVKLNGLDPYDYLSDVLKRLPTQKMSQIEELLPHKWKPA
jgi:hypothetical protein